MSEKTALEPEMVISNILTVLEEKKYDVISTTASIIKFRTNPWALRWNFSPITLDGGKFELIKSGNFTFVTLSYYDSLLSRLFLIVWMTIVLISSHAYDGIIFFVAFFVVTGIIHHFTLKNKAKDLLKYVVDSLEEDEQS